MTKNRFLLSDHFRTCVVNYFFVALFALIGIGIGIYISVTGYRYTALLTVGDKNLFAYITGTASYLSIFSSRIFDAILCVLIVFLLSLNRYIAFFGYIFLGYQMSLVVLTSAAVITLYGIGGVINTILFIVPINLVNFVALSFILCVGLERAKLQSVYGLRFGDSLKESSYFLKFFIGLLVLLLTCIISSFILPLVIKSFVVVTF